MAGTTRRETAPGVRNRPRRRPAIMLAVLLLGQLMALLDVTIVNVATSAIGRDLHASGASLQLVVGGYTVAYAMLLITGARLGDMHGRRRMYLLGAVGFTITSLVCGFAPTSVVLVIARFAQGAAAAVMVPQIMSVIQMQFTGPLRARALSAYGAVLAVGAVLGLVLGGVLVNADLFGTSWRPVFLINVPLGIVLVALVPRFVPSDEPTARRRLDVAGLSIAASAAFLLVVPLVIGHELGWPVWTIVVMAAGLVLAVVFVRVERVIARRGGDPLLNLAVLHSRGIGAGLTTLLLMQVGYGGFLFTVALHLQAGLGQSPLRAGLTYVPMAAAFGIVGFCWRSLPRRIHPALPAIGLGVCLLSYLAIPVLPGSGPASGLPLWLAMVAYGAGVGAAFSPLLTQSLAQVPMAQAPDASGLFTTTMQLGQVIGVAAFGTIFLSAIPRFTPTTSSGALAVTFTWLAVLTAVGIAPAAVLWRTLARSRTSEPA